MDTSTGKIYEGKDVAAAILRGETNPGRLVGIPVGYENEVRGMSRKQRREWYRKNKKTLNLPAWGDMVS